MTTRFHTTCDSCHGSGYSEGHDEDNSDPDCLTCKGEGQVPYTGPIYLNVYLVHSAYGGPEEGGWWYDTGEPLESRPILEGDDEEAEKLHAKDRWAHMQSKHPRHSVLGGGDVEVYIEPHFARPFPERAPHYE